MLVGGDLTDAQLAAQRLERDERRMHVVARHRERHVGAMVGRHRLVLDDHVDVDVRVRERSQHATRDARAVRQARERDACLVGRVGHGCDERTFQGFLFAEHQGTRCVLEGRAAMDAHVVVACVLDRAQLQHAGARGGHLEHLLERENGQLARLGNDARVGAEDARHVGVDLADVGADRRGERDRGGVRAPAAERRDVARGADALESGHEHDAVLVERVADAIGAHVEDAGLRMRRVGHNARL